MIDENQVGQHIVCFHYDILEVVKEIILHILFISQRSEQFKLFVFTNLLHVSTFPYHITCHCCLWIVNLVFLF